MGKKMVVAEKGYRAGPSGILSGSYLQISSEVSQTPVELTYSIHVSALNFSKQPQWKMH